MRSSESASWRLTKPLRWLKALAAARRGAVTQRQLAGHAAEPSALIVAADPLALGEQLRELPPRERRLARRGGGVRATRAPLKAREARIRLTASSSRSE